VALVAVLLALPVAGVASRGGAATPPCAMSTFSIRFGPEVAEATGQHTLTLRLVNGGRRSCVLFGYPVISAFDRRGRIPFAITHDGDQMVTAQRPKRLRVRPREAVFVALNHYRCDRGDLRTATVLRIGAKPARTVAIRMTNPYQRLEYCGKGDPGSTVAVSPFEPTLYATLRRH
jgi:hypothetical protein